MNHFTLITYIIISYCFTYIEVFKDPSCQTECDLKKYLAGRYQNLASQACHDLNVAGWNYNVDLCNDTVIAALDKATLANAEFTKKQWERHFRGVNWQCFQDECIKRQVKFLSVIGTPILDKLDLQNLTCTVTQMQTIYSSAKICPYNKQDCNLKSKCAMSLDPGIETIMGSSRNYDELAYVWRAWRDQSGKKMKKLYKTYVELENKAACLNGFQDAGEWWRYGFEYNNFVEEMDALWREVEPFYLKLHAYVKNKLRCFYSRKWPTDYKMDMIPAHILGNMWAQNWINVFDIVKPFCNASEIDVTANLQKKGYDPYKMFCTADNFYKSLGLPSSAVSFGKKALIVKPRNKEVVCHASAWDFCDGQDFRIKMCTKVTLEDFITIHHEMGHIQYYIQYKHLPIDLRRGANPGFHEAIGDTIALSVSSPKHLQKIGLLCNYHDTYEDNINALMFKALEKIAFLPFGYLIDKWRWDVFSHKIPECQWNSHWWKLREKYQRIRSPCSRSEKDFDPGAKFHVPADSEYISYFVANILQFQLHKALCIAAKEYDPSNPWNKPLHKCDIYKSKQAGKMLCAGMRLGGSRHWSKALKAITGEEKLCGLALKEYFQPLEHFFDTEDEKDKRCLEDDIPSAK